MKTIECTIEHPGDLIPERWYYVYKILGSGLHIISLDGPKEKGFTLGIPKCRKNGLQYEAAIRVPPVIPQDRSFIFRYSRGPSYTVFVGEVEVFNPSMIIERKFLVKLPAP